MNNKSTYQQSNRQDRGKKKFTIGGGIIVFLIAISPYFFYVYESFPNDYVWKTSFFESKLEVYTWYTFAWILTGKIMPLYLLLIWFFTCKHWWHWIILVPIFLYIFQTWGVINQGNNADEVELYYMLPVMLILVPMVYLIRAKIFSKVRGVDDMKDFEEDLKRKRTLWQEFKELFQ